MSNFYDELKVKEPDMAEKYNELNLVNCPEEQI